MGPRGRLGSRQRKEALRHRMLINDRWPVEALIEETAKCDVVCANCHRIRTCERRLFDASLMVSAR